MKENIRKLITGNDMQKYLTRRVIDDLSFSIIEGGKRRGIIFDDDYTLSLFSICNRKNLISPPQPLCGVSNHWLEKKVLTMLTLYETAYIPPIDIDQFSIATLLELRLIDPYSWNIDELQGGIPLSPEQIKGLRGLIIAALRQNRKINIPESEFEKLFDPKLREIYNPLIPIRRLPKATKELWLPKGVINEPALVPLRSIVEGICFQLKYFMMLSEELKIPVLSRFLSPRITHGQNIKAFIGTINTSDLSEAVLAIYFKDSLLVPNIETIEDLLNLRLSKNIEFWRKKVFSWLERLQQGTIGDYDIKREIRDANNAIRDLDKFRIIKDCAFYFGASIQACRLLIDPTTYAGDRMDTSWFRLHYARDRDSC